MEGSGVKCGMWRIDYRFLYLFWVELPSDGEFPSCNGDAVRSSSAVLKLSSLCSCRRGDLVILVTGEVSKSVFVCWGYVASPTVRMMSVWAVGEWGQRVGTHTSRGFRWTSLPHPVWLISGSSCVVMSWEASGILVRKTSDGKSGYRNAWSWTFKAMKIHVRRSWKIMVLRIDGFNFVRLQTRISNGRGGKFIVMLVVGNVREQKSV